MRDGPDIRRLLRPPWSLKLVWLLLPTCLALVAFGLLPLRSWDTWWHMHVGRHVVDTGDLLTTNTFLYTLPADAPSFVQPWLAQTLLYELYELGGLSGLLTLRSLLTAGVLACLTLAAIRRSGSGAGSGSASQTAGSVRTGSLLALAGLAFAFPYIAVRTHLFAWPLFVLMLLVGHGIRARRLKPGWAVVFPITAALWVQLHGSFPLAVMVPGTFAAAALWELLRAESEPARENRRAGLVIWGLATVATVPAVSLSHPRGLEVWSYVVMLATDPAVPRLVTEWQPTSPTNPMGLGLVFYGVLAAAGGMLWHHQRDPETSSVDPADLLLFAATGLLAALQARGLLWFGLTLPIALAPYFPTFVPGAAAGEHTAPGRAASLLHAALAVGLVVLSAALLPVHRLQADLAARYQAIPTRTEPPGRGRLRAEVPVEAVDLLVDTERPLRFFHDQRFAGYLLWRLDPPPENRLLFVDQRIELPPPSLWQRYVALGDGEGWRELFREDGVSAVLVTDRQAGLRHILKNDDDVVARVHYEDPSTTLFLSYHPAYE